MKNVTKTIFGLLILIAVFVWFSVVKSPSGAVVKLFVLNVGQGDAILIEKGNYQILIDGGPDDSVLSEIGTLMPITDRKIEVVILSHPHADHITGINQILSRYEVGQVYYSGVSSTSNAYAEFLNIIKEKNIQAAVPELEESIVPFENARLTFLWPGTQYQDQEINNLNNSSEVVRFCYFSDCALLTGDIETDEQATMFAYLDAHQIDIASQILKIPHHGSSNGTNEIILDKIKPIYAAISVGADNQFGHPHASILKFLDDGNVKTYRTDRDGTIEFDFEEGGIIKK